LYVIYFLINFLICHQLPWLLQTVIISKNSGFNDAPPTKNPSMFGLEINSDAFLAVTDPPYCILTPFEISSEKFSAIQDLIYEWAYSA